MGSPWCHFSMVSACACRRTLPARLPEGITAQEKLLQNGYVTVGHVFTETDVSGGVTSLNWSVKGASLIWCYKGCAINLFSLWSVFSAITLVNTPPLFVCCCCFIYLPHLQFSLTPHAYILLSWFVMCLLSVPSCLRAGMLNLWPFSCRKTTTPNMP